jgi:hypothetical protein
MELLSRPFEHILRNICESLLSRELHTLSCACKYIREVILSLYWYIEIKRGNKSHSVFIKYDCHLFDISDPTIFTSIVFKQVNIIISTRPEIHELTLLHDCAAYRSKVADNKNIYATIMYEEYKRDCAVLSQVICPEPVYDHYSTPCGKVLSRGERVIFHKHIVFIYKQRISVCEYIGAKLGNRTIIYPTVVVACDNFTQIYRNHTIKQYAFLFAQLTPQEYCYVNNAGQSILNINSPKILVGSCKYRTRHHCVQQCTIMHDERMNIYYLLDHNRKKIMYDKNINPAKMFKKLHQRLSQDTYIME